MTISTKTIAFDTSKKQELGPLNGFKTIIKKLKSEWKVEMHKEDYGNSALQDVQLLIIPSPKTNLTSKEFVGNGGNLLFLATEATEFHSVSNFNYFLEEYGISVHEDSVCRGSYFKYFHPKQVLVTDGIMNREVNRRGGKLPVVGAHETEMQIPPRSSFGRSPTLSSVSLTFVYPYGATLSVQKPATILLSTGTAAIPYNQPICAIVRPSQHSGKILVVGSELMFHDDWIDKEENGKIFEIIFDLLMSNEIVLNTLDSSNPETSEYHHIPNILMLSNEPRICFEEADEIPVDFNDMFETKLYSLDASHVPSIMKLQAELGLPREPLSLIEPAFDLVIPSLKMAVYPPVLAEPDQPMLELFDLDSEFASNKTRLAQLTNKCTDEDLEFYVQECGKILGISDTLPGSQQSAKHVLNAALKSLVQWKMLNPEMS